MKIYCDVKLHHKMIASFTLILLVIILVGVNFIHKLSLVNDEIAHVITEINPTLVSAKELEISTNQMLISLGLYMLDKEAIHLKHFDESQSLVEQKIQFLKSSNILQDKTISEELGSIAENIQTVISFKPQVVDISSNISKNILASQYANEHANPISIEMSQLLSGMISVEEEEESSDTRKAILADLNNLRYAWANLLTEIRLYLAFRSESTRSNILDYKDLVMKKTLKVESWEDELTFEQEDGVEQVLSSLTVYFEHLDELIKIHESDKWRMDAWFVRVQINPIQLQLHDQIKKVINTIEIIAEKSRTSAEKVYVDGQNITLISIFGTALLLIILAVLLIKNIWKQLGSDPKELLLITQEIAAGNLNNTAKSGKVTGVYDSVLKMQDSLRENIEINRIAAHVNGRIKIALDNVDTNVLIADEAFKIIYLNNSIQTLFDQYQDELQFYIPTFDSENIINGEIMIFPCHDDFHESAIKELKEPKRGRLKIGICAFNFVITPVYDDEQERIGTVLELIDYTHETAIESDLQSMVEHAQSGILNERLDLKGKQGFFQTLSTGINTMLDVSEQVISETVNSVNAMSHGDLNHKIEGNFDGSYAELKNHVNTTIDKLSHVVVDISAGASQVHVGSKEIATGNNKLSQRTIHQAASLDDTVTQINTMTESINQNALSANQADQLAIDAREEAVHGSQVVNQAVQAMSEITTSSNQIVDIISVIDEIAFQTNLLALNAAVEAARAGEQGRGFAVVATEVRNLAGRSASAAKEIKSLIEDSNMKVSEGSKLVNASGETLSKIMTSITEVSDVVTQIASASGEQSSSIALINESIKNMKGMTQENSALADQVLSASDSMGEQAKYLNDLIGFFSNNKLSPGNSKKAA